MILHFGSRYLISKNIYFNYLYIFNPLDTNILLNYIKYKNKKYNNSNGFFFFIQRRREEKKRKEEREKEERRREEEKKRREKKRRREEEEQEEQEENSSSYCSYRTRTVVTPSCVANFFNINYYIFRYTSSRQSHYSTFHKNGTT